MNSKTRNSTRTVAAGLAAVVAAATFCSAGPALAGSVTLKGKGTYFVDRKLMPLGNGGAALHVTNTSVVSVEPSESGVMFGECAGLSYLSPDATIASRLYCNFTENGKDTFVVQADLGGADAQVKVIGGSGKWKDATGTGKVMPLGESDAQGRYSYEFQITTP